MNYRTKLFLVMGLVIFTGAGVAMADLEWVTGGSPKSGTDKSATAGAPDAPPTENRAVTTGNQDIILSHLITCTNFSNHYPVDSFNFFYPNKSHQGCFYAYFLMKPSS